MQVIGLPARMTLPFSSGIGKRALEPIAPSAKSDAAQECASPCWYCTPMLERPKRWVKRAMAIIIAHCSSTWSRVNSLTGSVPNANFMPRSSYHLRHSSRSDCGTLAISTSSADCDRLSIGMPMSTSAFCGNTPLIMPMQKLSNRPTISLLRSTNSPTCWPIAPAARRHHRDGWH